MQHTNDYYPFGMRLPGLSYQAGDENPYLYNGKEWEDDHGLNWYHYGARYYDPQLGRWHSVDPADEFVSPYLYCRNNPIICYDSDGRYTYEVHGTGSTPSAFAKETAAMWPGALGDDSGEFVRFEWNGYDNGLRDLGAEELATDMLLLFEQGEEIYGVGHSHGGNVLIEAINIARERNPEFYVNTVALVGTPIRDDYRLDDLNSVRDLISVYSKNDLVQVVGGELHDNMLVEFGSADRVYPGSMQLDATKFTSWWNPIGAHSQMHNNPSVIDAVKSNLGN